MWPAAWDGCRVHMYLLKARGGGHAAPAGKVVSGRGRETLDNSPASRKYSWLLVCEVTGVEQLPHMLIYSGAVTVTQLGTLAMWHHIQDGLIFFSSRYVKLSYM